jgi:hypothetical protein
MKWKTPYYILFEKDGYQLELKETKTNFNWKLIKVKYNKKIKHSNKILSNENILYWVKTCEQV